MSRKPLEFFLFTFLGVSPLLLRRQELILEQCNRLPISSQYSSQISEALNQQAMRMEKATAEEKRRKAALAENRKRPSNATDLPDSKRIKLESGTPSQNNSAALLSTFDFTSLPAPLITNLVVANLEAFSEAQLITFVNAYRQSRGMHVPIAQPSAAMPMLASPIVANSIPRESPSDIVLDFAQTSGEAKEEKEEVIDPLQMDIDEEEMEYEPEKLNKEVCSTAANQKIEIIGMCIARWCTRRRRRHDGNRPTS